MSIGESDGGLPPDHLVEDEVSILNDCIRVIDRFLMPLNRQWCAWVSRPVPIFGQPRIDADAALLARDKSVFLHTHLAENDEDIAYSLENRMPPRPICRRFGWTGDDVWHAHCVKLDGQEIDLFSKSGTGVACIVPVQTADLDRVLRLCVPCVIRV